MKIREVYSRPENTFSTALNRLIATKTTAFYSPVFRLPSGVFISENGRTRRSGLDRSAYAQGNHLLTTCIKIARSEAASDHVYWSANPRAGTDGRSTDDSEARAGLLGLWRYRNALSRQDRRVHLSELPERDGVQPCVRQRCFSTPGCTAHSPARTPRVHR